MGSKRDYYEVLGVSRTANTDELRKAYRQLALKHHPDRNPDDPKAEALFKEATEAYGVISDDAKRARYDQFGHAGLEGAGGFEPGNVNDIFSHFQDLFTEFFGGRSQRAPRGSDLRVQQSLSLREAVTGCKREICMPVPVECDDCRGSGAAAGTSRRNCDVCGGSGQVSTARGFVMFTQTCPRCRGQGSMVDSPCKKCRGAGHVEKNRKVMVTFPAGVDSGQRLRVPGQGATGPGGAPSGDLYVDIEVEADTVFERDELDLLTRLPLTYAQAALGTKHELELLDGTRVALEVSAGAQPGDVISLRNKGVPRVDGRGRGALHVVLQVAVPRKLSSRARTLLKELDAELQGEGNGSAASSRATPE